MGIVVNHQKTSGTPPLDRTPIANLIWPESGPTLGEALSHYQNRADQLNRMYDLNMQLGEKPDLASMIESFSLWLMPKVKELDRVRNSNNQLERRYHLHRQLGEKLDLASMLETFSTWLRPHLDHELVAYRHFSRNRQYIACSCHGPHRQRLIDAAEYILDHTPEVGEEGALDHKGHDGFWYRVTQLSHDEDRLLLIRRGAPSNRSSDLDDLVAEMSEELHGPIERALTYEELYDQARRDTLTGLVNRRVFDERLNQEIANAQRYGHPLALAYLDLDHFKAINDRLGHADGDDALKAVSKALLKMIRGSDLLARTGGDEFALILPNTVEDMGFLLMKRLCKVVKALNIQAPGADKLGVSIGLACWQPGLSVDEWLKSADDALYRAKAAGRSTVCI
ncbi:MAG: GGDEF domain-containing protein [Magnetococcales bacterium]|nr:GGDEF domain-containing protein [Magnetococcales bacterium]